MKMYNYSMVLKKPDGTEETRVACGSWHTKEEMAKTSMERRKCRTNNCVDAFIIHKNFNTNVRFEGKLKRNESGKPILNTIDIDRMIDSYTETFYGNDVRITVEILG